MSRAPSPRTNPHRSYAGAWLGSRPSGEEADLFHDPRYPKMEIFMVSPAPCLNPLASPLDEGACSSKCQGSEMKQKSWETSMGELKLSGVFLMSRSDRQTLISQCPLVERSGVHCFPVDFPLELLQSTLNAQGPFQIPWL